jgi:hypothetical protein
MSGEVFYSLTDFMLTRSSDLIFKQFYSLDIYVYPFNLFRIEPLIVHSYLNDVILIQF